MHSTELYLIRHGIAGEHGIYANDSDRPLTEEGHTKTKRVAKRLQELGIRFDLVQTSPLVRARQTAEILQQTGLGELLEESMELAPAGDFDRWLLWLQQWRQEGRQEGEAGRRLAIVGHEPGLGEWTELLLWGRVRHQLIVKKAGVIGLILPTTGSPLGRSELFWLTPPKFLC